jgi:predicted metal-dependent peptidase
MKLDEYVINDPDFWHVKKSIMQCPDKENIRWKYELIELLNDSYSTKEMDYFYNMMVLINFMFIPDPRQIAFTTEDCEIYMNAPHPLKVPGFGKNDEFNWKFTFMHECLHQFWETFEVAKEIQKDGLPYNHELLNIASDCVINEFLNSKFKLKIPQGLITAETIENDFDVVYNPKEDTQYSLYKKIIDKLGNKAKNWKKGPDGPPPPPGGDPPPMSDDYIAGWNKAIEDFKNGKIKL